MNEVYGSYFEQGAYPARTTLEMPALVGGAHLEISCIGFADADRIQIIRPDPSVIPPAMGPYSSAVMAGDTLYLSGQGGRNPQSGEISDSAEEQAAQTLETIGHILATAELDFSNAAFVNVYYPGADDLDAINTPYMARFQAGAAPSRGAFNLSRLPGDIKVEITFIAAKDRYITHLHPHDSPPGATSSRATLTGGTLYSSAHAAPTAGDDLQAQFRAVMAEHRRRLEQAGMGFGNVVNANVYLSDTSEFAAMDALFREYFPANPPARTTVGVREQGDHSGVRVEVALIAVE
jgi:2-iminobutanoate/2-iminopropanoate deaminase